MYLFSFMPSSTRVGFITVKHGTWTQSTSERSKLVKLLKSMKGEEPKFENDYDYSSEIGLKVQITVGSKTSKKDHGIRL